MLQGDTIAAVATAPGEGGVAIIRISGPEAAKVLRGCFCGREDPVRLPRRMVYGRFMRGKETVDLGLAVYMPAPGSFTGEDTAELHCHGGQASTQRVLEAALEAGARMAQRGERLETIGAQISRTTLANWIIYCSENYFQPMYDYFDRELLKRSYAMADETRSES